MDEVGRARSQCNCDRSSGGPPVWASAKSARCGESGPTIRAAYEATPLEEGTYFVTVQAKPWYAVHGIRGPSGDTNEARTVDPSLDVAYPITYYGDTTEADQATPIPIRGGAKSGGGCPPQSGSFAACRRARTGQRTHRQLLHTVRSTTIARRNAACRNGRVNYDLPGRI